MSEEAIDAIVEAAEIDKSSEQGLKQAISTLSPSRQQSKDPFLAKVVKNLSSPRDLDLYHRLSHDHVGLHAAVSIEKHF